MCVVFVEMNFIWTCSVEAFCMSVFLFFFFFSDFTFFFLSWKMTGVKCFVRVFIAHGCMFLLCTDESDICFFFSLFLVFVHRICFVFTYLNKVLQSYALWLISFYCQSALCDHSEAVLVK